LRPCIVFWTLFPIQKIIGMIVVANFAAGAAGIPGRNNHAHLTTNKIGRKHRQFTSTGQFRDDRTLMQACAKPEKPISVAAIFDTSMIRSLTKGPRSVIRAVAVPPVS
jgi:hypothetical protein